MCADFWSEKKSVQFFLGAACNKKSVVCVDLVREKIGPPLRLFLGAPYDKKSVRVRWAKGIHVLNWHTADQGSTLDGYNVGSLFLVV